jgi:hypothetical protein
MRRRFMPSHLEDKDSLSLPGLVDEWLPLAGPDDVGIWKHYRLTEKERCISSGPI